jgi:kynureninase
MGFSRAVRSGDRVLVSGTAPVWPDGSCPPEPATQARRCLAIILAALAEAGAGPADVVRTRIYLTAAADAAAVGAVHAEVFGSVRPAATMVVVAALLDPRWRVEIEAEAMVAESGHLMVGRAQPGRATTAPPGRIGHMDRAGAEALDRADALSSGRGQFPIPDGGPIYLDGNSLGRPSHSVREAIAAGVREWQAQLVGGWRDWIELPSAVGDRVGLLVGAGPGQVVVCDSTTVNLYKAAAAALAARPERTVIVGDAGDFPTDRYVLAALAEDRGCELRLVDSGPVDGVTAGDLAAVVDRRTALVCLSHVNYRSAARLDLPAVTELAHECGALMCWDLSHSAGAVPVGLDAAGADLAVGCTYKYLNAGPGAPGYLYARRGLADDLRQPIAGWFGQQDQFEMGEDYRPVAGVGRFLTGSPPILGLLAVQAGVELLLEPGLDRLWTKSQALTALLTDLIADRLAPLGATLASPADPSRRGAHVAVAHPDAWSWCAALIERQLVVPDFRPPDVIRLGPAPLYTRFVDVYDAVDRMAEVLAAGLAPRQDARPRVT